MARSVDVMGPQLREVIKAAAAHDGSAFIEIFQNCNIFNDGAFFQFTEKDTKPSRAIFLEHDKPMVFDNGTKGIKIDGYEMMVLDLEGGKWSLDDCLRITSYNVCYTKLLRPIKK